MTTIMVDHLKDHALQGGSGTPPGSPGGRLKAPPVCSDTSLKSTAMTTSALSELVFPTTASTTTTATESETGTTTATTVVRVVTTQPPSSSADHVVMPISSSSSTCTRESDTFSDAEVGGQHHQHQHQQQQQHKNGSSSLGGTTCTPTVHHNHNNNYNGTNNQLNAKVSLQKTSRQGRLSQRWLVDPGTNETIRLVTGCVPILKSGKILFVSSSRQSEWILPKGGWEQDEAMEESAVRECFEEAGVLGTLGPPLKDVQYETRKAKKRRLEQEELRNKRLKEGEELLVTCEAGEAEKASFSPQVSPASASTIPVNNNGTNDTPVPSPFSKEDLSRIRWLAQQNAPKGSDETLSVASNVSGTHSQVRMKLFPLYVTEVHDHWPESGRLRTAVDIDQAIKLMDARPEFKVVLQEVKDRGLHLVSQP